MNSLSQGLGDCSEQHSNTILPGLAAFVVCGAFALHWGVPESRGRSAMHSQAWRGKWVTTFAISRLLMLNSDTGARGCYDSIMGMDWTEEEIIMRCCT